jgi:hypothetical protein
MGVPPAQMDYFQMVTRAKSRGSVAKWLWRACFGEFLL